MADKESDARHEAAHVAMYCILGHSVKCVSIKSGIDPVSQHPYGGYTLELSDLPWADNIMILEGGPYISLNVDGIREFAYGDGFSDKERIDRILNEKFPNGTFGKKECFESLQSVVKCLLDAPEVRFGIEMLAKELVASLARGEEEMCGMCAQNIFNKSRTEFVKH